MPSAHPRPSLIDTHCHLTATELGGAPDEVWRRARDAGVDTLILIGTDVSSCVEVVELVASREGLFCAVGIHPNETARADADALERIAALLDAPKVVAVGESGLDLHWDDAPQEVQERALDAHAELALSRSLPLVLHVRDAYPRVAELLRRHVARGLRGVIHCFAGEEREVDPFLDWGFAISFSGILTYARADNVRGAARRTPLDLCLLETDAPWLTPAAERGKVNEPAFLVHTAQRLAAEKGVAFEEIAAVTSANARRVFGLPDRQ
jgi:TatD DNase family protein